ncbi:MAG: transcriptional regulator [Kiloniella sp.]|nr:transcriptional regulator [Kiloniella sp.]RZO33117.1 MAG: transcriptional regulator [Rhodospirillaceae bacterium]
MTSSSDNDSGLGGQALRDEPDFLDVQSDPSPLVRGDLLAEIDIDEATRFLRALSNQNRLGLVNQLLAGERTVSQLADALKMRQPAVSQQLARLRESGIVEFRRSGKTVYYRLATARISQFLPLLQREFPTE